MLHVALVVETIMLVGWVRSIKACSNLNFKLFGLCVITIYAGSLLWWRVLLCIGVVTHVELSSDLHEL